MMTNKQLEFALCSAFLMFCMLAIGSLTFQENASREYRCKIIGHTPSTLLEGTTASGERVIIEHPPLAVCKGEPPPREKAKPPLT